MLLWKYCHSPSFSCVNFRTRFKHAHSFYRSRCSDGVTLYRGRSSRVRVHGNFGQRENLAVRHVRMSGTLLCLLFLVVLLREFRESSNFSFMHPERCTRLVISLHSTTSSAYYKLPFKLASRRFNGGRLL